MRDYKARPENRSRKPQRGASAFRRRKESLPKGFAPLRPPESARPERPSRVAGAVRAVGRTLTRLRLGALLFALAALWALAGLAVGGWALAIVPLEEVTLEGREEVSAERVLALGQLTAGMALTDVEPFDTALRIAGHPRIVAADVRRRFPGRLSVRVRERQPALRVLLADGRLALIDRENVVLNLLPKGKAPEAAVAALPVVIGVRTAAVPSEPLHAPAIRRARQALVAMREVGLPVGTNVALATGEAFRLQLRLPNGRNLVLPYEGLETALRTYQALHASYPHVLAGMDWVDLTTLEPSGGGRVVLRKR